MVLLENKHFMNSIYQEKLQVCFFLKKHRYTLIIQVPIREVQEIVKALGVYKDSRLRVSHHRPGQEESRTRPMILYQVPYELLESTFPQKALE